MSDSKKGPRKPTASLDEAPEAAAASFESELERLETSVGRLESGDLRLEDAIREFERGVTAWRRCGERLADARRRVEILCSDLDESDGGVWRPAELSVDARDVAKGRSVGDESDASEGSNETVGGE